VSGVYFDSSVFTSIFKPEQDRAKLVKELLKELKKGNVRIHTSILSVQECSVPAFRRGTVAKDYHAKINELASVHGITKVMAMTAAKLEAGITDFIAKDEQQKQRRKWDCFHVATAMELLCERIYSWDKRMIFRGEQLGIKSIEFLEPQPINRTLDFEVRGAQPRLLLAADTNEETEEDELKTKSESS
jgi:predicted nucleic acid-binding protein